MSFVRSKIESLARERLDKEVSKGAFLLRDGAIEDSMIDATIDYLEELHNQNYMKTKNKNATYTIKTVTLKDFLKQQLEALESNERVKIKNTDITVCLNQYGEVVESSGNIIRILFERDLKV